LGNENLSVDFRNCQIESKTCQLFFSVYETSMLLVLQLLNLRGGDISFNRNSRPLLITIFRVTTCEIPRVSNPRVSASTLETRGSELY
jgi:hypothetical protein